METPFLLNRTVTINPHVFLEMHMPEGLTTQQRHLKELLFRYEYAVGRKPTLPDLNEEARQISPGPDAQRLKKAQKAVCKQLRLDYYDTNQDEGLTLYRDILKAKGLIQ